MRTFPRDGKRPRLIFKKTGNAVLARQGRKSVRLPLAKDINLRLGRPLWRPGGPRPMVIGEGHKTKQISWDEETAESLALGAARAVLHENGLDRGGHKTLEELVEAWDDGRLWDDVMRQWRESVVNQVIGN